MPQVESLLSFPEEQSDYSVCPDLGDRDKAPTAKAPRAAANPPSRPAQAAPAASPETDGASAPRPGDGPELTALIRRAQQGDRDSFERLIEQFQDRVWRRALYRLGDHDEASDLAQEVFLICFRKLDQFRGESKFWTWLCRIIDNQVKNRHGWLQRRGKGKTFSLDSPPGQGEEDPRAWDPPDPGASPRRLAEGHEAMDALNEKLGLLSAEHREILLLRFSDGLSYEEISETLELSLGTVKSRINRARTELRTLMANFLED